MNKDNEYSEDEEVKLPKNKEANSPLYPLVFSINHPTVHEDNPPFTSFNGPQVALFWHSGWYNEIRPSSQ